MISYESASALKSSAPASIERLNKVIEEIGNMKEKPKFVAVLGDISSSSGNEKEFQKAQEILNTLNKKYDIPYVPLIGNHDAKNRTGFRKIFWEGIESANNTNLLYEKFDFFDKYSDGDIELQNYAFIVGNAMFIAVDSEEGDLLSVFTVKYPKKSMEWLDKNLKIAKTNNLAVVMLSHIPVVPTKILGFDAKELLAYRGSSSFLSDIKKIQNLLIGTKTLAWFSGHIHGYDGLPMDIKIGDTFYDANMEYLPLQSNDKLIPMITTESFMVGSNEKDDDLIDKDKGIIKIVKMMGNDEYGNYNIDYDTNIGKYDPETGTGKDFIALNPYIRAIDYQSLGAKPCVNLRGHTFTRRESSLEWEVREKDSLGWKKIGEGEKKDGYCPDKIPFIYEFKLTAIDKNNSEIKESITQEFEIKMGIIPKLLIVSEEAKGEIELFSTTLEEDLTKFRRTVKDVVLIKVKHSPAEPTGLITVHFENANEDIDMTELIADIDSATRKSILHMPVWPDTIEEEKILFIPSTGIGKVYICPNATSMEEVNLNCENKTILELGETKNGMMLSLTNYEGSEYYVVYGVTGTGGGESEAGDEFNLDSQISVTQMFYDGIDILNVATQNIGDNQAPLLLSELKEATVDLEDYSSNGKLNPGQKKKLKMKFKFLETAGNEYQGKSINVNFKFLATQEEQ